MNIKLLHSTPLHLAAYGARTCWDSTCKSDTDIQARCFECDELYDPFLAECPFCEHENTHHNEMVCGEKDKELIDRVGNKFKHQSVLEHVSYTFSIKGVSRALLQELSRHRLSSPSVRSTRYTLKVLKTEEPFCTYGIDAGSLYLTITDIQRECANKYLVFTGKESVDVKSICALEMLRQEIVSGTSNDLAKYCLPEAFKTELQFTINMRSLQNFLSLRSDKSALWEIRELSHALHDSLPEEHKYMFIGFIKDVVC